MTTKERISDAALGVFNRKGTEQVTLRELAKEVGISHGNLCYHFPSTDDIAQHLYFALVAELDGEIQRMQSRSQNPAEIFTGSWAIFNLLYKYRFLMLNFVDIMRRLPEVKKHYRQLQERRKAEFKALFKMLVDGGFMQPEIYPGFFDDTIVNMTILGDFWIAHSEILFKGKESEKLKHYYRITSTILLPLLTEKGQKLFLHKTETA